MFPSLRQLIVVVAIATLAGPLSTLAADGSDDGDRGILRLVRVYTPSPQTLHDLHGLGIDILNRESPQRVRVAVNDDTISTLDRRGFQFEIIELDLEAYYRVRLGEDAQRYHTFAAVVDELDRLHAARPDIVSPKIALGMSWEGRPIWAVKISDHVAIDEDEPEVLYDSLHHAREPVSMETLLHAMRYLVAGYDSDPEVRYLVDERELWFVPVVNPDGYARNGIGGLWRKNRRPNADGSFGVDLNRNYGYRWGYDDLGSSSSPSSQTYRGPYPFSEPESRAMRDFILAREFVTGMTVHSFSDVHLLPYGWSSVRPADYEDLRELGEDLQIHTNYPYGQPWELLYFSNGRSQDWAYGEAGILMIEPEIGRSSDGFWPPAERLTELVEQNLPSILHMAKVAGAHVAVVDHALLGADGGPAHGHPGEMVRLEVDLRNKGYAAVDDLSARLTASTPAAIVRSDAAEIGSLAARTTRRGAVSSFLLSLSSGAAPGVPLALELELRGNNGYIDYQTLTIIPGNPELVFTDDAENGGANWRTNGSWGVIELDSDGGRAYADSPQGPYAPRSDNALVMREPIDLAAYQAAHLVYSERFFVEPWADPCRIEATADGARWVTLATLSGGTQNEFRERRVSLNQFTGLDTVKLRFRLTANSVNQKDGWTIDDIRVWGYVQEPATFSELMTPPTTAPADLDTRTLPFESE